MDIYLASASPTRKKLLKEIVQPLGLGFSVISSEIDESLEKTQKISSKETQRLVVELAREKAREVAKRLGKSTENFLIIAADTLIWFDNKIYGKPRSLADAYATLSQFRGKIHWALTGLVLRGNFRSRIERNSRSGIVALCAKAKVYMKKISDEELQKYVDTGEPLGKAGSYAILQKGSKFFQVLEGEPETVAGLPVKELKSLLKEFVRL